MDIDLLSHPPPAAAGILEVPYELFLLAIHTHTRLPASQMGRPLRRQVLKLLRLCRGLRPIFLFPG